MTAAWQQDPAFANLAPESDDDTPDVGGPVGDVQPAPDRTTSDLTSLAVDAAQLDEPVRLKVDARPGWVVAYRTDLTIDELEEIHKGARRKIKGRPAGLNVVRVNRHILAVTCVGLRVDGAWLVDDDGDRRTFRDPGLIETLGVRVDGKPGEKPENTGALGCVAAFFRGRDGEIAGHVERVMAACGYGGEPEDDDGVDPSSGA